LIFTRRCKARSFPLPSGSFQHAIQEWSHLLGPPATYKRGVSTATYKPRLCIESHRSASGPFSWTKFPHKVDGVGIRFAVIHAADSRDRDLYRRAGQRDVQAMLCSDWSMLVPCALQGAAPSFEILNTVRSSRLLGSANVPCQVPVMSCAHSAPMDNAASATIGTIIN
jgi:hypothetical protein